ncbi:hypothetical protein PROFUN_10928 [Planoprotostelium fungivorum]|uniref:Right handed beta helix domain-containing protein n=1 Tax=Planoprotostelium fungivorum TaxID=1890364 RepID=A0A2P6NC23_9EUKA|nr:hypothetical protein PROFUN_10928 [Planoprotostelium fungivorum]
MMTTIFFLLFVICGIVSLPVEIHVNERSGTDALECGSNTTAPCRTLSYAFYHHLNSSRADDLRFILDGTFSDDGTLNANLTAPLNSNSSVRLSSAETNQTKFICSTGFCQLSIDVPLYLVIENLTSNNMSFLLSASSASLYSCTFYGPNMTVRLSPRTEADFQSLSIYNGHVYTQNKLSVTNSLFSSWNFTKDSFITITSDSVSILLENSRFTQANTSANGAALSVHAKNSSISILSCSFNENHSQGYGGAIYIDADESTTLSVSNTTIYNNTAVSAGGAIAFQYDIPNGSWNNNQIEDNHDDIQDNHENVDEGEELACLNCDGCDAVGVCAGNGRHRFCFVAQENAHQCPGAGRIGLYVIIGVVTIILALGIGLSVIFSVIHRRRERKGYTEIDEDTIE